MSALVEEALSRQHFFWLSVSKTNCPQGWHPKPVMEFTVGHTFYGANAPASVTRYAPRNNNTPRSNFSSSVKFERDEYCACCQNALKSKGPTLTIDAPYNTLVNDVGEERLAAMLS